MCSKKTVGIAIGAIAMLAMAMPALRVPALSQEVGGVMMFDPGPGESPGHDEVFELTTVIQVPAVASNTAGTFFSFDISWVDPVLNKYFLADRNNKTIDVIDPTNVAKGVSQQFPAPFAGFTGNNDTSGPDGVLTVPRGAGKAELWVGDSNTCKTPPCVGDPKIPDSIPGEGRVWILDASTGAILSPSPIGVGGHSRADELCFDPNNQVIMIASPAEDPPYVTFISTATATKGKVLSQLTFDGKTGNTPNATNGLEQCGWSPTTGKFYQNVPAINGPAGKDTVPGGVSVIDPKTAFPPNSPTVEQTFTVPLDACAGPQGMAIGPHNQILLGCNADFNGHRNIAIINQHSGAVLNSIADLGGADEVWFNENDFHYIIPNCNTECRTNLSGGKERLGIVDANGLRLDQSVEVADQNTDTNATSGNPRAIHSAAASQNPNLVFLPIPACTDSTHCGNLPHFSSTLCDTRGLGITVVGHPSTATGCITVLAAPPNNDRPTAPVAQERGKNSHQK
jgi:hypothetical protein